MELFLKGLKRGGIAFTILLILSLWARFQGASGLANFIYGIIFFFLGLTSVIYEIRQWSFLKQILAHYLAMLVTVFPTLLLSGFYPVDSYRDVMMVYLQFNKVGVMLFLLSYFISNSYNWFKRSDVSK